MQVSHRKLGWQPKFDLEQLVSEMIQKDKAISEKESFLIKSGYKFAIPKE